MQIKNYIGILGVVLLAFTSCKNDDDQVIPEIVIRDVAEQTASDDERLVEFLKTHFYNYEDFENGAGAQIVFDSIGGENSEKTSLFEQLGEQLTATTITFADIDHKVYVLKAREGAGEAFSFADSVFVNYKGIALNELQVEDSDETVFGLGSTFDSTVTPTWFSPNGAIPGFMMGFNGLKGASDIELDVATGLLKPTEDYSIGAVFIPSFLAYYANPPAGIAQYQSLIFTFDLLSGKVLDDDNDGVPSSQEDANNNLILTDDDADGDGTPDFLDEDTK